MFHFLDNLLDLGLLLGDINLEFLDFGLKLISLLVTRYNLFVRGL